VAKYQASLPNVIDGAKEGEECYGEAEESKATAPRLENSMTILEANLPPVDLPEYEGTRVRIGSEAYLRSLLSEDLQQLLKDREVKLSCEEEDQVYYIEQAIANCEIQLARQPGSLNSLPGHIEDANYDSGDEIAESHADLQLMNKQRALRKQHGVKENIIAENSDTCFYYYQVVNGENLFLHPLCLDILLKDRQLACETQANESAATAKEIVELPPFISGKVVEMTAGGQNWQGHARQCEFLGHLPPAASYQLVELDLSTSQPTASPQALAFFASKLQSRQKARN